MSCLTQLSEISCSYLSLRQRSLSVGNVVFIGVIFQFNITPIWNEYQEALREYRIHAFAIPVVFKILI